MRRSKHGRYKGKRFRSVWEYSFYRHLEALGVDLEGVGYEAVEIPYRIRSKACRYLPDFHVPALGLLVEVKSGYGLSKRRGRRILEAKFKAAEEWCKGKGLTFKVMTEKDFPIIPYDVAYADKNVEWIRK